jgi:hypothetical protein
VAGEVEPGAGANVPEAAGGQPLVELILGPPGPAVLQEIHVEQAVVVEVEQGGPGAHDLRQEVTDGAGVVDEVQPGLLGDVGEPGRVGRFFRGGRGDVQEVPAEPGESSADGCENGTPAKNPKRLHATSELREATRSS